MRCPKCKVVNAMAGAWTIQRELATGLARASVMDRAALAEAMEKHPGDLEAAIDALGACDDPALRRVGEWLAENKGTIVAAAGVMTFLAGLVTVLTYLGIGPSHSAPPVSPELIHQLEQQLAAFMPPIQGPH